MSVETDKVVFDENGLYSDTVVVGTDDGLNLYFKDQSTGGVKKTLSNLWGTVPTHPIGSHSGMSGDFATQYYNKARLDAYLASAAVGNLLGISGDVGGNTRLGAHVADGDIHQRVPRFVLRVAKGGQTYQTIAAALAAIPTSGDDAPGPYRRWRVEVSPGAYEEAVLLDKPWVDLVGAGPESTVIRYSTSTQWPLRVMASNVRVFGLQVETSNPSASDAYAVVVGDVGASMSLTGVVLDRCAFDSVGRRCAWVGAGVTTEFVRCEFEASSGAAVYSTPASATFTHCGFDGGDAALEAAGGESVLVGCRSGGDLLIMSGGRAAVRGCYPESYLGSTVLYGGSSGTVYWDGQGFAGTINPAGSPSVNLFPHAGMSVTGELSVDGNIDTEGSIYALNSIGSDVGFFGDGGNLTNLNASQLSAGTIPAARFPSTLPAANASALTSLNASALASGTVPDGRLSSNVARRDLANTFTAVQTLPRIVRPTLIISANVTISPPAWYGIIAYISSGARAITLDTNAFAIGEEIYFEYYNQNTSSTSVVFDAGTGNNIARAGGFAQTYTKATVEPHRWFRAIKYAAGTWAISTGVMA